MEGRKAVPPFPLGLHCCFYAVVQGATCVEKALMLLLVLTII